MIGVIYLAALVGSAALGYCLALAVDWLWSHVDARRAVRRERREYDRMVAVSFDDMVAEIKQAIEDYERRKRI